MRQLTKAEACRELAVSLSTLDRRIASGEIRVSREPRGRRHRVYVMLDDDLPGNGASARSQGTLLDMAQERIRVSDEQVTLLQAPACAGAGAERRVGGGLSEGACRARQDEASGFHPWFGRRRAVRAAGRRRSGCVASADVGAYMLERDGTAIGPVVGMPVGDGRQLTGDSPMPHYLGKTR